MFQLNLTQLFTFLLYQQCSDIIEEVQQAPTPVMFSVFVIVEDFYCVWKDRKVIQCMCLYLRQSNV